MNKSKSETINKNKQAFFGAGCFWGVEEIFSQTPGVSQTEVGYMGGETAKPTYVQVCTGETGHAEVVSLLYNPTKITFNQLLEIFWQAHDPSTLNRQGPDVGSQYRSVIFYTDNEQKLEAEASKIKLQEKTGKKAVTQIVEAGQFWRAEEYHQKYLEKQGLKVCH